MPAHGCARCIVRTRTLTPMLSLLLILLVGCGAPSEEEVAAKADEVVPRTQELVLLASFSPVAECRELAAEFAEQYDVARMPYDGLSPKAAMSKLEQLENGLGGFEKDLEKAGCSP